MHRSGENGATHLPSLFSQISNHAPILYLQLSSTPHGFSLSITRPQAVPLSQVLTQMQLFSLPPYFRRVSLTRSTPLWEGLIEQWPNEQWPNVGCTQEGPLDPAAAGAPKLWPGASSPQKKFMRQCSSSVSGIMENHNTHLAPGFTLNEIGRASCRERVCLYV